MGIFRPFIGGVKTLEQFTEADHSNDKPFTPADSLTVARPLLALRAAQLLIKGKPGALKYTILAGLSDMEGIPARQMDRTWPNSGWGTTEHGARWDTYADSLAVIILGAAILIAPRVTPGAKLATAAMLGQEGVKTGWAILRNHTCHKETGQRLALPTSQDGKEAMAEKLTGLTLAVATTETDNVLKRAGLTAGALCFAGVGAWRGEQARKAYEPMIAGLLAQHTQVNTDKL